MASSLAVLDQAGKVFRELAKQAGVEHVVDLDGRTYRLATMRDVAEFVFRLPRVEFAVEVTGEQLSSARFAGGVARVVDFVAVELNHAARCARGQQIVDLANGEWSLAAPQGNDLERIERAALRLMQFVDDARKAGA